MTNRAGIKTLIDRNLPDNDTGAITPAKHRAVVENINTNMINKDGDTSDDLQQGATNLYLTDANLATALDTVLVASGNNVSITKNGDTIEIAVTQISGGGTPLTQEQVEDFVNNLLVAGVGVDKVYADSSGTLTLRARIPIWSGAIRYKNGDTTSHNGNIWRRKNAANPTSSNDAPGGATDMARDVANRHWDPVITDAFILGIAQARYTYVNRNNLSGTDTDITADWVSKNNVITNIDDAHTITLLNAVGKVGDEFYIINEDNDQTVTITGASFLSDYKMQRYDSVRCYKNSSGWRFDRHIGARRNFAEFDGDIDRGSLTANEDISDEYINNVKHFVPDAARAITAITTVGSKLDFIRIWNSATDAAHTITIRGRTANSSAVVDLAVIGMNEGIILQKCENSSGDLFWDVFATARQRVVATGGGGSLDADGLLALLEAGTDIGIAKSGNKVQISYTGNGGGGGQMPQPADHEMAYFWAQNGTDFSSSANAIAGDSADVQNAGSTFTTSSTDNPHGVPTPAGENFCIAVPVDRSLTSIHHNLAGEVLSRFTHVTANVFTIDNNGTDVQYEVYYLNNQSRFSSDSFYTCRTE